MYRTLRRFSSVVATAGIIGLVSFLVPTVAYADIPGLTTLATSGTAAPNTVTSLGISCPTGEVAVSGGVEVPTNGTVQIIASMSNGAYGSGNNGWGWVGAFNNTSSSSQTISVEVVCATGS